MPTNQLLPFATGAGANVLDFASYSGLTARQTGFQSGTALSPNLNSVWRQSAFVAAMIGQFTVDNSGQDVLDDGDVATFLANFKAAVGGGLIKTDDLVAYSGFYPYGSIFSLSATTGQIIVDIGQSIVFRGVQAFSTSDLTLAQRTFATQANKTYHLRWHRVNGLALKDLADAAYNPSSLAETHASFDSKLDDALIARVTTNGSNAPTGLSLANQTFHSVVGILALTVTGANGNSSTGTGSVTLNFGRTPQVMLSEQSMVGDGSAHDTDLTLSLTTLTRYSFSVSLLDDYSSSLSVFYHASCIF